MLLRNAVAWLVLLVCLGPLSASAQSPAHPNIILVNLDDASCGQLLGFRSLRRYSRHLGMKQVDFSNAYVTTPSCCASRASLLTGRYAHNTGILYTQERPPGARNGGATAFKALGLDRSTIATWLRRVGYRTHLIGKYLNSYNEVEPPGDIPPGWDNWHAVYRFGLGGYYSIQLAENGRIVTYGNSAQDYSTDLYTALALGAIASTPSQQPLFLYYAPSAPHAPATPAPRHGGLFSDLVAPRSPGFGEADVNDKPLWIRNLPWDRDRELYCDTVFRSGARSLASVDEGLVAMLFVMNALGRLNNTVLIITNDNGFSFGEHRHLAKGCAYEAAVHIPLLVMSRNPELIPESLTRDEIVANIDIAPTVVDLAGITNTTTPIDGESLLPLFRADGSISRRDLLIEHWSGPDDEGNSFDIPTWAGVVDPEWKYVELSTGEFELYDRLSDGFELDNAAYNPEMSEIVSRLAQRLESLRGY